MGIYIFPKPTNFLNLSGGTVTGSTYFSSAISALTIYSGTTNLYNIFGQGTIQNGQNIGSGFPIFSGVSGSNLYFRSISAGSGISITTGDTLIINSIPGSDTAIVVKAATLANVSGIYSNGSLSGIGSTFSATTNIAFPAQDSVSLFVDDLVLLKNQNNPIENGVYKITQKGVDLSIPFILTRDVSSDETSELSPQLVFISSGTTQKGQYFNQAMADPIIGTDNIIYDLLGGINTYVTQQSTGSQVDGQIPSWSSTGRQLKKGSTAFVQNPTTGWVGISTAFGIPMSFFDVQASFAGGAIHTVTANTSLNHFYKMVLVSATTGNITISIPNANTCNRRELTISKIDSTGFSIIISPSGGKIDGQNSRTLTSEWSTTTIKSDGINWYSIVPTTSLSNTGSTSFGNFLPISGGTVTGNTFFSINLSAATMFSGSTNLYDIFTTLSSVNNYWIKDGNNNLYSTIISSPVLTSSNYVFIPQGNSMRIEYSDRAFVINGINNNIYRAKYGAVLNGNSNVLGAGSMPGYSTYGLIGNGKVNRVYSKYGAIINGKGNHIYYGANYSVILNGAGNYIHLNTVFSGVFNGFSNRVHGSFVSILNGYINSINNYSTYGIIINGRNNIIGTSSVYSTIINGKNNIINNNITCSTIAAGSNITADTSYTLYATNLKILSAATAQTFYTNRLTGDTIYSGGTELSLLFPQRTIVQNGINTTVGGTSTLPSVNVTALTINTLVASGSSRFISLSATSFSAATINSGSTPLDSIFVTNFSNTVVGGNKIIAGKTGSILRFKVLYGGGDTVVSENSYSITITTNIPTTYNIFKRGTGTSSIIPVVGLNYSLELYSSVLGGKDGQSYARYSAIINGRANTLDQYSRNSIIGNGISNSIRTSYFSLILNGSQNIINSLLSPTNNYKAILNGYNNKIYGNSPHSSILAGSGNYILDAQYSTIINGKNRTLLQSYTTLVEKLRIADLTNNAGSYMLVSDTNGYIFKTTLPSGGGSSINNGINTFTAGTPTFQSVNVTALTINNLSVSAATVLNTLSANTFSAATINSGSTNLYNIFATFGQLSTNNNGINTFTGGTPTFQSINITALTINNLTVTGTTVLNTLSANTFSAATINSGSTNLYNIFATLGAISTSNVWTAGTGTKSIKQTNTSTLAAGNYSLAFGKSAYANSHYSIVISHSSTLFSTSTHSTIIGGSALSTSQYTSYESLIGGKNNSTIFSNLSFLGGGQRNIIEGYAKNYFSIRSTTVGGYYNKIYRSINSGIFAGNQNTIGIKTSTGRSGNTIIGGFNNTVISQYSSIVGGSNNRIFSYNSGILAGSNNIIKSAYGDAESVRNFIIAGQSNYILNSINSGIIGGTFNSAFTVSNSVIIGGTNLTVSQSNTVVVPKLRIAGLTSSTGSYMIVSNSGGYLSKTALPVLSILNGINTTTGGTVTATTINVTALTINTLVASGSSRFVSLSATSLSASTINSGNTDIAQIFHVKNGYLLQKNGLVSGSTFAGSPLMATVVFGTSFTGNNYSITVTGEDARMWSINLKSTTGFTINSNSSVALTGNTFWMTAENGEGYR